MHSLKSYLVGYALSIIFTLAAFGMMALYLHSNHQLPTALWLTFSFILFALAQLFVQLYFFLQLGQGNDKRSNLVAFGFALFVVLVLVGGTLWIMSNVGHRSMQRTPFINHSITAPNEND